MLILILIIAAATVIYPLIIYTSLDVLGPAILAWGLFLLLLARVVARGEFRKPEQYLQLLLVGGLCVAAAWLQSEALLRYYPVAMSVAFAAFFWLSLHTDTPLIERFARMRNRAPFAPHQRAYMRRLTVVWAGLLLLNAGVAAYTACCMSLAHWALYNGVISYFVLGLFSMAELVIRHYYRKRHEQPTV